MPSRTPAAARAAMDEQSFPNRAQERAARAELERLIDKLTMQVTAGTAGALKSCMIEAWELAQAATEHNSAVNDLQVRMKRREISTEEAHKERDRLRREEMKLSQLLDSITHSYE